MNAHVVTHQYMEEKLRTSNPTYIMHFIGRALVALMKRQTEDERNDNATKHHNNRGFMGSDARSGTISAKYYIKHNRLEDWMIDNWMKEWKGRPRITKYWKQLDEVAKAKRS